MRRPVATCRLQFDSSFDFKARLARAGGEPFPAGPREPVGPQYEEALDGQPDVERGGVYVRVQLRMDRHVQVGREDGYQHADDAPRRGPRVFRDQEQEAEQDFEEAAQEVERPGPGQVRRHDVEVELGISEMIYARDYEEDREQIFHHGLEYSHSS